MLSPAVRVQLLLACALPLGVATDAGAQVFRCVIDGKPAYQQQPCDASGGQGGPLRKAGSREAANQPPLAPLPGSHAAKRAALADTADHANGDATPDAARSRPPAR